MVSLGCSLERCAVRGFSFSDPGSRNTGEGREGGLPETFDKQIYFLFSGQITHGGGECVCGVEEGKWGKGGVQRRFFSAILVQSFWNSTLFMRDAALPEIVENATFEWIHDW